MVTPNYLFILPKQYSVSAAIETYPLIGGSSWFFLSGFQSSACYASFSASHPSRVESYLIFYLEYLTLWNLISIMNWADNVNWPPKEFQTYVSSVNLSSERNVSFGTLYGGQFTLSTQFTILNYPVQYTLPPTQHHSFFRNLPLFI